MSNQAFYPLDSFMETKILFTSRIISSMALGLILKSVGIA